MNVLEWIILIGGAGGVVAAGARAVYNLTKGIFVIQNELKDLKTRVDETYMNGLKLTIMSSDMPIGERIVAGNDYIHAGGNGEIKEFVQTQLGANKHIHTEYDE